MVPEGSRAIAKLGLTRFETPKPLMEIIDATAPYLGIVQSLFSANRVNAVTVNKPPTGPTPAYTTLRLTVLRPANGGLHTSACVRDPRSKAQLGTILCYKRVLDQTTQSHARLDGACQ